MKIKGRKKMDVAKSLAASGGGERSLGVRDVEIGRIGEAAWNVHAPERKGDLAFRGLVESIKANGIIQRVVVREVAREGDEVAYEIVDGHRRVYAARAAGLKSVPCEVVRATDAEAQVMTATANLQRTDNDPILEAELIARLAAAGMTFAEVAAKTGKTESYVARRARLVALAGPWRAFGKRVCCTTDLLERVAAHDVGLQERIAADVGIDEYEYEGEGPCCWSEFEHLFRSAKMLLCDAAFDTGPCATCPKNTASMQYLFDFMREDGDRESAQCQDKACFAERNASAVAEVVARLKRSGRPAIEVADKWRIPNHWDTAGSSDTKHPQAYVYGDGASRRIVWGVPPQKTPERAKETQEERAARMEKRRRDKLVMAARRKVRRLFQTSEGESEVLRSSPDAGRAYGRIAEKWLETTLAKWVPDELCDIIWREIPKGADGVAGLLTDDEAEAYGAETGIGCADGGSEAER